MLSEHSLISEGQKGKGGGRRERRKGGRETGKRGREREREGLKQAGRVREGGRVGGREV